MAIATNNERPSAREALKQITRPGLSIWRGALMEEQQKELRTLSKRMSIFREMRRDSLLGALLDAMKSPLLAADWDVVPGGASGADKRLAAFLNECLEDMDVGFHEHQSDALEALDFGFALSEIVLKRREGADGAAPSDHNDGLLGLATLSPIGQETLDFAPWQYADDGQTLAAVVQRDPVTGELKTVPAWKLLHVTLMARKRNPEGESVLAALWRDWRFRRNFEELEGIGVERDVGGMPVAYPPHELTTGEQTDINARMKALRNDEAAYVVMPGPKAGTTGQSGPPGWLLESYASGSKAYDVRKIINDYDARMLQRFFAMFLRLGQTQTGSYALVQGSHDFFYLALRRIQQRLLAVWNGQLIPLLVQVNAGAFRGMTALPTLTLSDPGKPDIDALVNLYREGVAARALTLTAADEDHLRAVAGLPDRPDGVGEGPRDIPPGGAFPPSPFKARALHAGPEDEPPAGQEDRTGRTPLTTAVNAYQLALVAAYDRWGVETARALERARTAGGSPDKLVVVLDARMGDLAEAMVAEGRKGIMSGARAALKGRELTPDVLSAVGVRVREHEDFVRTSLIPDVRERVAADLLAGVAEDKRALAASLERLRYRPAQYAGGAWVMGFDALRIDGAAEDKQRAQQGQAPVRVRWVLDPSAEHCQPSEGRFGCPELAREYPGGWAQLPTIPAGDVTCIGNCRCHIEWLDPDTKQWERA